MKKRFQTLLLALSTAVFAESMSLPLEKGKTDRSEAGVAIYEIPGFSRLASLYSVPPKEITGPGKITFMVRAKQFSDRKNGCHFGIQLFQDRNQYIQFYSQKQGISVIMMKNGIRTYIAHQRGGYHFASPSGGQNSKWAKIEIRISSNLTEVFVNSVPSCTVPHGSLPVRKIALYGYYVDFEATEPCFIPDNVKKKIAYRKDPVFHLPFENSTEAFSVNGKTTPVNRRDLRFTGGVSGKALKISNLGEDGKSRKRPLLVYDVKDIFRNEGTLSFWYSPDWNGLEIGSKGLPTYLLMSGTGEDNVEKLRIFMWNWLRFDLGRTGKLQDFTLRRNGRGSWFRGDFHHLALVWRDGGWNKAYIDGIPFEQPWNPAGKLVSGLDLNSIRSLFIGRGPAFQVGEGAYDEVKVYNRVLSSEEISAEYRKIVPVDQLLFKNHFAANQKDFLTLFVSPGGSTVVPKISGYPDTKAEISLKIQLVNRKTGTVIPLGTHNLNVDREIRLQLPLPSLPAGFWLLQTFFTTESGKIQRSFSVISTEDPKTAAPGEIRKGKILFEKKITPEDCKTMLSSGPVDFVKSPVGGYAEAGKEKGDRFSFVVPIPEEILNGKPCLLEVDWPDDKARTMGLYMYVESKAAMHRDRVGGGILAGDEYPNSFQMRTIRYLFYPGKANYLFEARTMVPGMPAAVSAVRIYELQDRRLPSLALNLPKTLPSRSFGFFDEDQSFDQNLNYDNKGETASPAHYQHILNRLAEYLDYVGKDSFSNPFFRYLGRQYPSLSAMHTQDWNYTRLTEYLGQRGKKVYATLDIKTLPHLMMFPEKSEELERSGKVMLKSSGMVCKLFMRPRPNHVHPEMRIALIGEIGRVAELYGKIPGFSGICLWSASSLFSGFDSGYEDITIAKFTRDTGVAVPFKDMPKRKEYLSAPGRLEIWLKWRAEQSTKLFREMAETLRKFNPDLELILMFEELPVLDDQTVRENLQKLPARLIAEKGGSAAAAFYMENGLDFSALKKIPGIATRPIRIYNTARHTLHWGKKRSPADEIFYDTGLNRQIMTSQGGVCSYPVYFETFTASLQNKRFNTYFQNVDLKPHGRFFLKELVYSVYAADAQKIMFGAQPFGSWGHEAETREFSRAFRTLPAREFRTAEGGNDPVVVRYLNTPQGTWFYAASMLNGGAEVEFRRSGSAVCHDLSDNAVLPGSRIALKAFQLRSFFSADPKLKIEGVRINIAKNVHAFYADRVKQTNEVADQLRKENMLSAVQENAVKQLNRLFRLKQYAALDVVLFSIPVRELRKNRDNMALIRQQAEMAERGHYAVNCGSPEYLRIKDGTLFAPDRQWNGKYGYFGNYDSVTREIRDVKDPNPGLYRNEAYNIDGYRFAVPNGRYRVRLYMKIGFKRNAAPGYYMFDIRANGKILAKEFDVYTECKGDLDRAAVREYGPVTVTKGILELSFRNHQNRPWARLMNAIELVRVPDAALATGGVHIDSDKIISSAGEPVIFTIRSSGTGKVKYELCGDGRISRTGELQLSGGTARLTAVMKQPGWLLLKVTELRQDGSAVKDAKGKERQTLYGIMVSPFEIRPGTEKPVDFEVFWQKEIARLRSIPMNPQLREREGLENIDSFRSYDVTLSMGKGELPATALLVVPRDAGKGSLPIHLSLPGAYFGKLPMPKGYPGKILLFLNVHGIPNTMPQKWYMKMRDVLGYDHAWTENITAPEQYYYKRVILRLVRSMDFLKTLPEWNGRDFCAEGASQGGGLAIIAAALEPAVSECRTWVSAMCDHGGYLRNRQSGWPQFLSRIKDPVTRQKAVEASRYLDAAHFASLVRCPIHFKIGLTDTTCSASSIFAAYNSIPEGTEKSIFADPRTGHTQSGKYMSVDHRK